MSEKFVYAGPGKYQIRGGRGKTVDVCGEVGGWVVDKTGKTYRVETGLFGLNYSSPLDLVGTRLPPTPEDYGLSLDRVYRGSEIDDELRGRMLASQEAGLKWQVIIVNHNKDSWETVRVYRVNDTGALAYRLHGSTAELTPKLPPPPQIVICGGEIDTEAGRPLREWCAAGGAREWFTGSVWQTLAPYAVGWCQDDYYRAAGCTLDAPEPTPPAPPVAEADIINQRIAAAFERVAVVFRTSCLTIPPTLEQVAAELRKGLNQPTPETASEATLSETPVMEGR